MIPVIPADAAESLKQHLSLFPWFKGVAVIDIGPRATLEIRTTRLLEADEFIVKHGPRWSGYPMRPRLVAEQ